MAKHPPFKDFGLLLTRPWKQSLRLAQALSQQGVHSVILPALTIVPKPLDSEALARLAAADVVLFVSANAADALLAADGLSESQWPYANKRHEYGQSLRQALGTKPCIGMGYSSSAALKDFGLNVVSPKAAILRSEDIVHHPLLTHNHGRMAIVRAEEGRSHIKEALSSRGWQVDFIFAYRCVPVCRQPDWFAPRLREGHVNALLATSVACVEPLFATTPLRDLETLRALPCLALSPRIQQALRTKHQYTGPIRLSQSLCQASKLEHHSHVDCNHDPRAFIHTLLQFLYEIYDGR